MIPDMWSKRYILNDQGEPVVVDGQTALMWGIDHAADRLVRQECLLPCRVMVSTVFLAPNYAVAHMGGGSPTLYETMVFGGVLNEYGDSYATRDEALAGHAAMVKQVRAAEAGALPDDGVDISS